MLCRSIIITTLLSYPTYYSSRSSYSYSLQMAQSDVDIFCLQEVWGSGSQRRIRRELEPFYPYALSAVDLDTEPDGDDMACDERDNELIDAILICRMQRCPGFSVVQEAVCGILRLKHNTLYITHTEKK